jgi:hypothetical protein
MTNQHPITPPLELVQQWLEKARREVGTIVYNPIETFNYGAAQAARWGADQELESCCELMDDWGLDGKDLIECRRPSPPSLKEQALELAKPAGTAGAYVTFGPEELDTIRRALEALPND